MAISTFVTLCIVEQETDADDKVVRMSTITQEIITEPTNSKTKTQVAHQQLIGLIVAAKRLDGKLL